MSWGRRSGICFGVAICLHIIATPPAFSSTASDLVDEFHRSLVELLKSSESLKERCDRFAPRVRETFNIPLMMQTVTGRRWRLAAEQERADLVDAFARLSILIYVVRLDAYAGERFELLGEREGPQSLQLVLTRLVRSGADPMPITYVTKHADGDGWRVVDIIFDGAVSEVQLRRSEYRNTLDQGGIAALTQQLNQASERILAQPPRLAVK